MLRSQSYQYFLLAYRVGEKTYYRGVNGYFNTTRQDKALKYASLTHANNVRPVQSFVQAIDIRD